MAVTFELNDEIWGVDPIINKVHMCQGIITSILENSDGQPVYVVEFDHIGLCLMQEHQITKNIASLHDLC